MDRKMTDIADRPPDDTDCNSNDSNASTDDKTYHFRKGSDLDGFESFGALFADGLFTDLAICCAGRVFRCHRVVMAASSAYIKNALSAFNGSENNNCNTIMILPQEIKVADMEAILQFIYNGQVEVTRDAIESFLSSAKILHIKGLANIKLVYNNNGNHKSQNQNQHQNSLNQNQNQNHKNQNNKNPNNSSNTKSAFNNENQDLQNFNHNNCNNNCNENNSNITPNINANNSSPHKRKNGLIGGPVHRSPDAKPDLNLNHKLAQTIPQSPSFPSPPAQQTPEESESKTTPSSARRKQKTPKPLIPNVLVNTAANGVVDEAEDDNMAQNGDNELIEGPDNELKVSVKIEDSLVEKSPTKTNGEPASVGVAVPSMPCLIQIDADPTTFPSFCPENNVQKSAKRRRSSSLRIEGKSQKSCGNSVVKMSRNSEPVKQQMVRTSNRKLGFIQFHKKSTTIWNSSNKWKCEICNKLYGNKQTLKEHMDYFHSNRAEQIFTCSICAKEYTWKKSLMKHYRDIHQINNTSLSQITNTNNQSKSSADETSTDVPPALEWVTQSQDNSSQSK